MCYVKKGVGESALHDPYSEPDPTQRQQTDTHTHSSTDTELLPRGIKEKLNSDHDPHPDTAGYQCLSLSFHHCTELCSYIIQ